jgi:hypothetical protein
MLSLALAETARASDGVARGAGRGSQFVADRRVALLESLSAQAFGGLSRSVCQALLRA